MSSQSFYECISCSSFLRNGSLMAKHLLDEHQLPFAKSVSATTDSKGKTVFILKSIYATKVHFPEAFVILERLEWHGEPGDEGVKSEPEVPQLQPTANNHNEPQDSVNYPFLTPPSESDSTDFNSYENIATPSPSSFSSESLESSSKSKMGASGGQDSEDEYDAFAITPLESDSDSADLNEYENIGTPSPTSPCYSRSFASHSRTPCPLCGIEFLPHNLKRHLVGHGTSNICPHCPNKVGFNYQKALMRHFKMAHPDIAEETPPKVSETTPCHICGINVCTNGINAHIFSHGTSFMCPYCPGKVGFKQYKTLRLHLRTLHPEKVKKYQCQLCPGKEIRTPTGLMNHNRKFHWQQMDSTSTASKPGNIQESEQELSQLMYRCPICPRTLASFATIYGLVSHSSHVHSKCCCPYCPFWADDVALLETHLESNHRDTSRGSNFPCKKCALEFSSRISRKYHCHIHHPTQNPGYFRNTFHCPMCLIVFRYRDTLSKHVFSIHSKRICPFCPDLLDGLPQLDEHVGQNHPDKLEDMKRMCKTCSVMFPSCESLSEHVSLEHSEADENKETQENQEIYHSNFKSEVEEEEEMVLPNDFVEFNWDGEEIEFPVKMETETSEEQAEPDIKLELEAEPPWKRSKIIPPPPQEDYEDDDNNFSTDPLK